MSAFFTIAVLHFLAVASPGPDFAVVLKNAIGISRKQGVYTALGVSCGLVVHLIYCILGLAVVISQSEFVFTLIKVIGGSYLFYIGAKLLFSAEKGHDEVTERSIINKRKSFEAFREGFFTNILNPKATLFFLSVFVLVVDSATPLWVQSLYGLEMFVVTFLWFSFLSIVATLTHLQPKIVKIQRWVNRILGILLVLFGINLLFVTL